MGLGVTEQIFLEAMPASPKFLGTITKGCATQEVLRKTDTKGSAAQVVQRGSEERSQIVHLEGLAWYK